MENCAISFREEMILRSVRCDSAVMYRERQHLALLLLPDFIKNS